MLYKYLLKVTAINMEGTERLARLSRNTSQMTLFQADDKWNPLCTRHRLFHAFTQRIRVFFPPFYKEFGE